MDSNPTEGSKRGRERERDHDKARERGGREGFEISRLWTGGNVSKSSFDLIFLEGSRQFLHAARAWCFVANCQPEAPHPEPELHA